ncbi:hypothetical protein J437_LFUL019430 [Ladona fulva]|uniref:Uncharacterized protein n=1 Tax=Ladona fulva TaxID=123851 RepID=A0A8K0KU99_LADFU|nr:hypothetical protein J437_LFUL019430 [Ladona fulva]
MGSGITAMKYINNAIEKMKAKKPGDDYEPSMVRNFKVEYPYGELKFSSTLLHKPASPLKFKMIDRTD